MAIIVIEHDGKRRAAVIPERVLVGRRSMNHLIIDHRAVSRMHAWIERVETPGGGGPTWYSITDAGSRTRTKVNGKPIVDRQILADGDVIAIGPATLTFHSNGHMPAGAETFELPREPRVSPDEVGHLFHCRCGAPLWASPEYYGHVGKCRYCRAPLVVPHAPGSRANGNGHASSVLRITADEATAAAAPVKRAATGLRRPPRPATPLVEAQPMCGVCQSAIGMFEEKTGCPACGLAFHAECWIENYGCSAYGCSQVNALLPEGAANAMAGTLGLPTAGESAPPPFPWEFLLLAGSVFGALLGAVSFGVPALLAAGASGAYWAKHREGERNTIVLLAGALGVLGAAAGAVVSYLLYFGGTRVL
jgi:hypothetical protein